MPDNTVEFNRPEVQEPIESEEAKRTREQREALDFAREKVAGMDQPGVKFDSGPSEHLSEQAAEIIKFPKPEAAAMDKAENPENAEVDRLIRRFQTENPVDVLNEIMSSVQTGKIDPQTGQEFLSRVSGLETKDLPKAA